MRNWLTITLMIIGLFLFFFLILGIKDMNNWLFVTLTVIGLFTYLFFIVRIEWLNKCRKSSKDNMFRSDKHKKMSNFDFRNVIGIIAGIGFITLNVITYINMAELIENGHETIAIVTELRREQRVRSRNSSITVQYMVNGVIYNNRLNIQYNGTYIGEEVVILYNPNNPNKITSIDRDRALDTPRLLIIKSVNGVLLILLCVSLGRNNLKKAKYKYN